MVTQLGATYLVWEELTLQTEPSGCMLCSAPRTTIPILVFKIWYPALFPSSTRTMTADCHGELETHFKHRGEI